MTLAEVAGRMLETFRRTDEEMAPQSGPGDAEGATDGTEIFDYEFAYNGKARVICMPRSLLKADPDFQMGCIYGMLLQELKPRMYVCDCCGKVREPRFGFWRGVIVDAAEEGHRGG